MRELHRQPNARGASAGGTATAIFDERRALRSVYHYSTIRAKRQPLRTPAQVLGPAIYTSRYRLHEHALAGSLAALAQRWEERG